MAKIYISSTYKDLIEFRKRAYAQLRRSRHDVISMEDYNPGGRKPLTKCLEDVRAADIYVGLVAWRYGFVPDADNPDALSITECEYREAVTAGKEIVILLSNEHAPWLQLHTDSYTGESDAGARIKAFRERLSNEHTCGFSPIPTTWPPRSLLRFRKPAPASHPRPPGNWTISPPSPAKNSRTSLPASALKIHSTHRTTSSAVS